MSRWRGATPFVGIADRHRQLELAQRADRAPRAVGDLDARVEVHVGRAEVADRERVAAEVDGLEAVVHDELGAHRVVDARARTGTARCAAARACASPGASSARRARSKPVGQQRGGREPAAWRPRASGAQAGRRRGLERLDGGHQSFAWSASQSPVIEAGAWRRLVGGRDRHVLARRGGDDGCRGRLRLPRDRRARPRSPSQPALAAGWSSIVIRVGSCTVIWPPATCLVRRAGSTVACEPSRPIEVM